MGKNAEVDKSNPFAPPLSLTDEPDAVATCQRDQCPICHQQQSVWKAFNRLGKYHCLQCGVELVVTGPNFESADSALATVVCEGTDANAPAANHA